MSNNENKFVEDFTATNSSTYLAGGFLGCFLRTFSQVK